MFFNFKEYINGGELFKHLFKREHFREQEVKIYIGEITLALEHLHEVYFFNKLKNKLNNKIFFFFLVGNYLS